MDGGYGNISTCSGDELYVQAGSRGPAGTSRPGIAEALGHIGGKALILLINDRQAAHGRARANDAAIPIS